MKIVPSLSKLVFVVSLILVIVITASCVPAGQEPGLSSAPQEFETHFDENEGFSILYPQGWSIVPEDILSAEPGAIVAYRAPKAYNNFTPNFNIMIELLDTEITVQTYLDAALRHLRTSPGYKSIATHSLLIDGIPAMTHTSRQNAANGGTATAIQGFLVEDRTAWIITCICDSQSFKSFEPTFNTIINSFHFLSSTAALLSEITMTTGVDSYLRPLDAIDVFDVDVKEIHCSIKLSNAPTNTGITAEWIYVQGIEDLKNYKIDEYSVTTEGTRYVDMSLVRPYEGWPIGDYEVILYVNGEENTRVPFYVR